MSKQITIPYQGTNYTLEFNRTVVESLERQGLRINDMDSQPLVNTSLLLEGAFRMHHPTVTKKKVYEIYKTVRKRDDFIAKLIEMCSDAYLTLLDEPETVEGEDTEQGNCGWEASW